MERNGYKMKKIMRTSLVVEFLLIISLYFASSRFASDFIMYMLCISIIITFVSATFVRKYVNKVNSSIRKDRKKDLILIPILVLPIIIMLVLTSVIMKNF